MRVHLSNLRAIIQEILMTDVKKYAGDFATGDHVLFGKWKNKCGKIVDIYKDDRDHPTVEIEPVPKGRKKNTTTGLYKIWKDDTSPEEDAD